MNGNPHIRTCLLLAALFFVFADFATASERTLRCRGRLISIGDTREEVNQRCGEPDKISRWQESHDTAVARIFDYETERYQAPERIDTPIRMEIWIYDQDSTRLARTLHFENGHLIRIETGPKVGE